MEIRCSGLARPMVCAGSLFFTDLPPQEDSAAAREGTAAGEWLELKLTSDKVPGTHAKNGVPFDSDMEFYTAPIRADIYVRKDGASKILCEQRIDWVTRSGIWIRGSYDISYTSDNGTTLNIDDLKYGWGIVEAQGNWQLLGYAIGEVIRRQQVFEKIVMRIHQPRPHHEEGSSREWTLTYPELLAYKEQIEERMMAIAGGEKTLVTTEKCKYCPAAIKCPAFNKAFYRGVEVAHEFMQDNINEDEISFQLDLVARVSELIKIKADSLKALAVDRLKKGKLIPNYVTEPIHGDRKWKTGISPEIIKTLTGKDVIEQVMLSPAKAEKLGVPKEFVNNLVDRPFLGQKLKKVDTSALGNKIFGGGK